MKTWTHIFWLGTKELRSVLSDFFMIGLILWSFSFSIYSQATAQSETVNNASIAARPALFGLEESKCRCDELLGSAVESLARFGDRADPLRYLAGLIVGRQK